MYVFCKYSVSRVKNKMNYYYKYGVKNKFKKKMKSFGGYRKSIYLCTRFRKREHRSLPNWMG